MISTARARNGMVTAPHHLAADAGLAVLRDGGNAVEAMIAAAGAIAVVYPHMNAIGGDGFWLIARAGQAPVGIDACGPAAMAADAAFYRHRGLAEIPTRGPLAALTVAGTLSGWQRAFEISRDMGGRLPMSRLLEQAVSLGRGGIKVSRSQAALTEKFLDGLKDVPGFQETFMPGGRIPAQGDIIRLGRLADTLERIGQAGPDDFYRGELAGAVADDLAKAGSPLALADLAAFQAGIVAPLSVDSRWGTLFNLPPPTQGLAALMILALFERLEVSEGESFAHIHGLVEACKRAFLVRDAHVSDPAYMDVDPRKFLDGAFLDAEAARIDPARALPWPHQGQKGDTVWMGAVDGAGNAVSFIQSVYWEFGSGLVLPATGVTWQNRGVSFSLDAGAANPLMPGRRPFHTLNPALARLHDGRVMAYGSMGGEGQPQTQAAIFSRHVGFGMDLQDAVSAPRWLLGRTWGEETMTLKLESRFDAALVGGLSEAGHDIELLAPYSDTMGHAGAVVWHPDGLIEGASDPRSDGRAAGF